MEIKHIDEYDIETAFDTVNGNYGHSLELKQKEEISDEHYEYEITHQIEGGRGELLTKEGKKEGNKVCYHVINDFFKELKNLERSIELKIGKKNHTIEDEKITDHEIIKGTKWSSQCMCGIEEEEFIP